MRVGRRGGMPLSTTFFTKKWCTFLGETQGLQCADLVPVVYEARAGSLHTISAEVVMHLQTYDVMITLLQPTPGRVVLLA